jgi:hypothetical protein
MLAALSAGTQYQALHANTGLFLCLLLLGVNLKQIQNARLIGCE